MPSAYTATRFDVTQQVPSLPAPLSIAAWIFVPSSLSIQTSPVILVCFPGGSFTKAYYHLKVPGYPPDAYSFARYMAGRGALVVALEHLGVGESTWPPDGTALTVELTVQASAAVTTQVRASWSDGSLAGSEACGKQAMLVGVGHSLGATLLMAQQARYGSFEALALLGHTNRELRLQELAEHLAERLGMQRDPQGSLSAIFAQMYQRSQRGYMSVDRSSTPMLFHAADVPESVIWADEALATHIPGRLLQTLSNPQEKVPLAASIEVPVFLGNDDADVATNMRAEPAVFPRVRDITLFQLAGSAHCHNFAGTRVLLWDRLARWIAALLAG